ncbi:MAG TPA: adenosylmethionine--8-amino-7-oxononanoate transaminase [bacterium]|nr:adenosylmethionine--8-amino-7-oxononanoate transaminase [bacterium]
MRDEEIRKLKDLDLRTLWHPFTQMQEFMGEDPLIVERAEGCRLFDIEGREYIDGVSSLWVNVHGHRRPELDAALRAQLDKVAHSTMLGIGNVPAILLAEKLLAAAPKNLSRVFYSDNGSTANEIALKMAFQYWQQQGRREKTRFLALKHAYHGDTIGSVSVGGIDLFHQIFQPLLFQVDFLDGFDSAAAERLFAEKAKSWAACIVEPMIQGAAGMRIQPPGFMKKLAELCRRHEVLLICDEVATGFGRTGKMFAVEHEGVEPDFLCLAKGISGGYLPLAATLTTARIFDGFRGRYEEFKAFFHGHSYTGNPLACAAGIASLEIFERDRVLAALRAKIEWFREGLKKFAADPRVKEVRQLGLMIGIELVQDQLGLGAKICRRARREGVLLRPLGNVLVIMPPLAIDKEATFKILDVLYRSMDEMTQDAKV